MDEVKGKIKENGDVEEVRKERFKKKMAVFAVLLFVVFGFNSYADDGKNLNYFQDQDSDGLTDSEEKALGTDPTKADSDGDGYSDKTEIESGYDPLIPAPGDRVVKEVKLEKEPKVKGESIENTNLNLTDIVLDKLNSQQGSLVLGAVKVSDDAASAKVGAEVEAGSDTSEVFLEEQGKVLNETGATSTEGETDAEFLAKIAQQSNDLNSLLSQATQDANVAAEEIEMVADDEIIILPRPDDKDKDKVKKKEKEQIEKYLIAVGYVLSANAPFDANEKNLSDVMSGYFLQLSQSVVMGDSKNTKELKEKAAKISSEMRKIEVPYVIKEVHKKTISYMDYFLAQDEGLFFSDEDPMKASLVLGKMQAAMNAFNEVQTEIETVLSDYDIEMLDFSSDLSKEILNKKED